MFNFLEKSCWEHFKHALPPFHVIDELKVLLRLLTEKMTCKALWMTPADRGDRVVLLSNCCSTLRSRPLKSVGGLWVRVPRYWIELNASGKRPSFLKRSWRSRSADSDALSTMCAKERYYAFIILLTISFSIIPNLLLLGKKDSKVENIQNWPEPNNLVWTVSWNIITAGPKVERGTSKPQRAVVAFSSFVKCFRYASDASPRNLKRSSCSRSACVR